MMNMFNHTDNHTALVAEDDGEYQYSSSSSTLQMEQDNTSSTVPPSSNVVDPYTSFYNGQPLSPEQVGILVIPIVCSVVPQVREQSQQNCQEELGGRYVEVSIELHCTYSNRLLPMRFSHQPHCLSAICTDELTRVVQTQFSQTFADLQEEGWPCELVSIGIEDDTYR